MFGPIAALEAYFFNALKIGGRASRSEYWWAFLVFSLLLVGAMVADVSRVLASPEDTWLRTGIFGYWSPMLLLLTLVPNFTIAIRRLHDSGRSGVWSLVAGVPVIGGVAFLVLMILPSEQAENQWGTVRSPAGPAKRMRSFSSESAAKAGSSSSTRSNPLDAYAVLLQTDRPPSPDEVERRKQEVHEYFMRNVSRRSTA